MIKRIAVVTAAVLALALVSAPQASAYVLDLLWWIRR
jgi:hypothetical protein